MQNVSFSPNFDIAYNEYQKQKTFFRILCNKIKHSSENENLLDRHKVCAALCVSLLKCHFIGRSSVRVSDQNHDLNQYNKLNEQFAVAVSLNLLKDFIKDELGNSDFGERNNLFPDNNFIFPNPQNNEEIYEDTIVRSLYFANTTGEVNLHLISHIFFLIEQYHLLSIKSQCN